MSRCHHRSWSPALAVALAFGAACNGSSGTAERTITGMVAIDGANTLLVDSVVEVIVEGDRGKTNIAYELDAVVTASTATVANRIADRLVVGVDRPSEDVVRVRIEPLTNGTIAGQLRLIIPDDLELGVTQRGAQVTVEDMDGTVQVDSVGAVRVVDPGGYVSVGVQNGNVIIESSLPPGFVTEAVTRRGDLQLIVPSQISASFSATPGGMGNVLVNHPALPRPLANRPYEAIVNGGLNTVRLSTMNGSVIIQAR